MEYYFNWTQWPKRISFYQLKVDINCTSVPIEISFCMQYNELETHLRFHTIERIKKGLFNQLKVNTTST